MKSLEPDLKPVEFRSRIILRPLTNRKKINEDDVLEMAELISIRLSTQEACSCLGIAISTWNLWCQRSDNTGKFHALLARLRGAKIQTRLAAIERKGDESNDWRSDAHLLTMLDRDRFSTQHKPMGTQVAVISANDDQIRRCLSSGYKAHKTISNNGESIS